MFFLKQSAHRYTCRNAACEKTSEELYVDNDIGAHLHVQIFHKSVSHHRKIGTQRWIKNLDEQRLVLDKLFCRISGNNLTYNLIPRVDETLLLQWRF